MPAASAAPARARFNAPPTVHAAPAPAFGHPCKVIKTFVDENGFTRQVKRCKD
ncbi:MAG: hypothetical protein ACRELB_13665 [Polyangiaceae bacterium]